MQAEKMQILQNQLDSLNSIVKDNNLVVDNNLIFKNTKNELLRVRMPSQKEKSLAKDKHDELTGELYLRPNVYTQERLKSILKKNQKIDIDKLEKQKQKHISQLKEYYLSSGDLYSESKETIDKYAKKIEETKNEIFKLTIKITELLDPSIESRAFKIYIEYLAYTCTEKNIKDEEWVKFWNTFEEFENDNSDNPTLAVANISQLMMNIND